MLLTTCLDAGESGWQSAGGETGQREMQKGKGGVKEKRNKDRQTKTRKKRWLVIKCENAQMDRWNV